MGYYYLIPCYTGHLHINYINTINYLPEDIILIFYENRNRLS